MQIFESPHHEVFWCDECDSVQVDSTKPETGTYYSQSGHALVKDDATGLYTRTGKWVTAVFAFCHDCDPN